MPFPFTCPTCRHPSDVPDHLAGTRAKCPSCGEVVLIPSLGIQTSPRPDAIPVVSAAEAPVATSIALPSRKSGGLGGISILLVFVGMAAVFCCGGGGILMVWLFRGEPAAAKADKEPELASNVPFEAPPTPTKMETPSLAIDEDKQPPSYWIQMLRDPDTERVDKARERLTKMGIQAVPELRKAARHNDPILRLAAVKTLGDIGENAVDAWNDIAASLNESDAQLRIAAAQSLGQLGKGARPCLPQLVRASCDPNPSVRAAVAGSLRSIGAPSKEDAPKLLELWREPIAEKRATFVESVRLLKLEPESAAILFVPLLKDSEKSIRLSAMQSLEKAGQPARDQAFSKLLPLLDDSDADIRRGALACLGKLGATQPSDRPELEAGLRGQSIEMRLYCVESLGSLGQNALPSVPLIARLLSDSEEPVRLAAARALGRFGKASGEVVDELLKARRDSQAAVRIEAIGVLGNVGRVKGVLQALFDSLSDVDPQVREAAAKAIHAVEPPLGARDLPLLTAYLKEKRPDVRRFCAGELAQMGNEAEPVLPELLESLKDPDPLVRGHICAALGALGAKAAEAVPEFIKILDAILKDGGKEPGSQQLFRQAISALGKTSKPDDALPIWTAGLKSRNKALRKETLSSLSTIGEPARKATLAICGVLDDPELGEMASETLLKLGGQEAVSALAKIVDNGPASARVIAIKLLGKMGPEAKPALGALYRALQFYKGKEAGEAAREAIRAIDKK